MYTYIVVDDERLIRKGTVAKLQEIEELRCVGEAANGTEALALMETEQPDLVITDMHMPVMDGTELLPQLSAQYPDLPIIIISGYKDFEYAQHAIQANAANYLVKPFSKKQIQAEVKKVIQALEEKTAQQRYSDPEELEQVRLEYDKNLLKRLLADGSGTLDELTSEVLQRVSKTHDFVVLTSVHSPIINQDFFEDFTAARGFGDLALHLAYPNSRNISLLVFFLPKESKEPRHWQDLAHDLLGALRDSEQSQNPMVGISLPHQRLSDLHAAFKQSTHALNLHRLGDTEGIYYYREDLPKEKPLHWEKEEELLFRIESGEEQAAGALVEQLFAFFMENPRLSYLDIKSYCYKLTDQVRAIVYLYFQQYTHATSSNSGHIIWDTIFDLELLHAHYLQFFLNITRALQKESVYTGEDTVENIKTYVKRNYKKDITIEQMSQFFYLNRSYCSQLFHQQSGEKFVDFVNRVRIDKAKELLETTDYKMYQVGKLVGYDNPKYFFRVFKRREKTTPQQYQNQYRKQQGKK